MQIACASKLTIVGDAIGYGDILARLDVGWSIDIGNGVDELQELNDRLQARYQIIHEKETRAELYNTEGAELIICAYGTVARICKSAIGLLEKKGYKVGLFRPITVWPFPEKELAGVMAQPSVKKAVTVEISAGQMVEDVRLTVNGTKPVEFFGKPGSYTPTAEEIAEYIMKTWEA